MVELDREGIGRAARAAGGEDQYFIALHTDQKVDGHVLDAATPSDGGGGPANGGWFQGGGHWNLLVEGLDSQVQPWLARLAEALGAAGVTGTLSGARTAVTPRWARGLGLHGSLSARFGFRPRAGFHVDDRWACDREASQAATRLASRWLAHDNSAPVSIMFPEGASFWATSPVLEHLAEVHVEQTGVAFLTGYREPLHEVRAAKLSDRCGVSVSVRRAESSWAKEVEALRDALIHAPHSLISVASVSHRDWVILNATFPDIDTDARWAYAWHPEIWDRWVLEPCGMQLLTDDHLAHAGDLTNWRTTRLDAGTHLVEARELEPWFATPLRQVDLLPNELLDRARYEFGDMVLTSEKARELGLNSYPG